MFLRSLPGVRSLPVYEAVEVGIDAWRKGGIDEGADAALGGRKEEGERMEGKKCYWFSPNLTADHIRLSTAIFISQHSCMIQFIFTALHGMQMRSSSDNSVCQTRAL